MNFKVGRINNNNDEGSCWESHWFKSHFDFNLSILQDRPLRVVRFIASSKVYTLFNYPPAPRPPTHHLLPLPIERTPLICF